MFCFLFLKKYFLYEQLLLIMKTQNKAMGIESNMCPKYFLEKLIILNKVLLIKTKIARKITNLKLIKLNQYL